MNYQLLKWDSRFFGMCVAKVTVDHSFDSYSLAQCLERCRADVIYAFINSDHVEQYRPTLERFGGKCYDRKVTYQKALDTSFAICDDSIVETRTESDGLLQLAYASGHMSRFFLDPRFNPYFKALYGEWIRKAIREENSRVFTISDSHGMLGMTTVSIEEGIGRVGLIAVNEESRGKGLGMRLLMRCENYYYSGNVQSCMVVTQRDNEAACKLYRNAGYTVENKYDIWHIWKV